MRDRLKKNCMRVLIIPARSSRACAFISEGRSTSACAFISGRVCEEMRWVCVYLCLSLLLLLCSSLVVEGKKDEKKKNVLDLTERDVHRIYEQWEVSIIYYTIIQYLYNDSDMYACTDVVLYCIRRMMKSLMMMMMTTSTHENLPPVCV